MALTGKQKAAMLLMSLDVGSASELLKGVDTEVVKEIALELARLDVSGQRDSKEQAKTVREFGALLRESSSGRFNVKSFLDEMLAGVVGREKAEEIRSQIMSVTQKTDPFAAIRSVETDELVLALKSEHPQAVAVVLSELPAKKSSELIGLLAEGVQLSAIGRMTNLERVRPEVKKRIASMVCERLKGLKGETLPEGQEQTLRKLAIMLSGLEKDLRDRLLDEVAKNEDGKEMVKLIKRFMVTWEDIPTIADRSLQEALRAVESGKLAVAIHGADEDVVQKIRSNISKRAADMLDEETSLMQEPLEKEILDAREEVVEPLREANEEGTLRFVGR